MNGRIASILQDRIAEFTYVEKIAGLVRVPTKKRENKDIRIPVAIGVIDDLQCTETTLRDMIPDSKYRCIVYFEDKGCTPTIHRTRGTSWVSHLRLVCWVNTKKLGDDPTAGDKIMQQFLASLVGGFYNMGPFIGIKHKAESIPERGASLFSAYTYPEGVAQYLLFPYDAFAINIATEFRIRPGCEDQVSEDDEACWTPPTTKRRRNPNEFSCEELQDPITGLTAEQLGAGCLDCEGGTTTCEEIALMDGAEVAGCIAPGEVPLATCTIMARVEATADIIAECIPADKIDDVRDIICTTGNVEIIDQDLNVIATPACGTQYSVLVFDGIDGGLSNTVFTNSIVNP